MAFLRAFHDITTNQCLLADEQYQALLALGIRQFGMTTGLLASVDSGRFKTLVVAGNCDSHNLPEVPPARVKTLIEHLSLIKGACSKSCPDFAHVASHFEKLRESAVILTPVYAGKHVIGLVVFTDPAKKRDFTEADLESMSLLGRWIGSSLVQQLQRKELEKQRSVLARLEEAANIGSWEVDVLSGRLEWSAQTRRIHRVADDYIPDLASATGFIKNEEDRRRVREVVDKVVKNGGSWEEEVQLQTATGESIWVKSFGKAELSQGKCVRLFGTVQQVDQSVNNRLALQAERVSAEEAHQESRRLLSVIGQQLKAPLDGVVDTLRALRNEQKATAGDGRVAQALARAGAAQDLINDVLTYYRVTVEQAGPRNRPFHPHVMFAELIENYRKQSQTKTVSLNFTSEIAADETIDGDPDKLRHILCYLLDSAMKYIRQGEINLIALLRKHGMGSSLLLSIEGTASVGLRDTLAPLLSGENYTPILKDGFGAATVRALISQLGGELDAYSAAKDGVSYDIVLPVTVSDKTTASDQAQPDIPTPTAIAVLVVDDNDINQRVMEAIIAKFGLIADKANDGKEAVSMASDNAYDLIFMDCMMPELDGFDATRQILSQRLVPEHCIIAALTASTSGEDKQACKQAGMNAFLAKPVALSAVKDLVFAAMQNKLHAGLNRAG